MKSIKSIRNIRKFLRSQTMTEYAIIVALIALACIAGIKLIGGEAAKTFEAVGTEMETANSSSSN